MLNRISITPVPRELQEIYELDLKIAEECGYMVPHTFTEAPW